MTSHDDDVEQEPGQDDPLDWLLRRDSLADLDGAIATMVWDQRGSVLARTVARSQEAARNGWDAEAALLGYVAAALDSYRVASRPPSGSDFDDTLWAAWEVASSAWAVFWVLRRRPEVVSTSGYDRATALFYGPEAPGGRDMARSAAVAAVLGLMTGDALHAAKSHLYWQALRWRAGDIAGARRHLSRAAVLGDAAGDDFVIQGVALATGKLHEVTGNPAAAAEAYEQAVAAADPADHAFTLPAFEALAHCYRAVGRYHHALDRLDKAIAIIDGMGDRQRSLRARILRGLILEDAGDFVTGGAHYDMVAEAAAQASLPDIEFEALTDGAASLLKRNHWREAIDSYQRILGQARGRGFEDIVGATHNNLGQALLQADRPADALQHFFQALAQGTSVENNARAAYAAFGISDALARLGDVEASVGFHEMSLIFVLSADSEELYLQWASRLAGERFDPAESKPVLLSALEQAERGTNRIIEFSMAIGLAALQRRLHQPEEAEARYRRALERALAADPASPWPARFEAALAGLLSEDPARAGEAFDLTTQALDWAERALARARTDRERSEIIDDAIGAYGTRIRLLSRAALGLGPVPPQLVEDPAVAAFASHESAKAPSLVAALAHSRQPVPPAVSDALRDHEASLLRQRAQLEKAVPSHRAALAELDRVNAELVRSWAEMEVAAPEYARLRRGTPASVAELSALVGRVGPSAALVSFFVDGGQTTCFVVRPGEKRPQVRNLDVGRAEIESVVTALRRDINGRSNEFPPYPPIRGDRPWTRPLEVLDRLSPRLLAFLPDVADCEVVCLAPHGPLHLIPFAALRAPGGNYLIEQIGLATCPTLTTLRYVLAPPTSPRAARPRCLVAGVASRTDRHPEFFETDGSLFDPETWDVNERPGPNAAAKEAIRAMLGDHDLIHLTCHGFYSPNDPLASGLVLSDGADRPPKDPLSVSVAERQEFVLTARELLDRRISAELVVLRACVSGVQREQGASDELVGLASSLLLAGASSLMVSLWNVDQRSSQELLRQFYRAWQPGVAGREKWRALALAQRRLIGGSDEAWRHPYHWASLVLAGDWR